MSASGTINTLTQTFTGSASGVSLEVVILAGAFIVLSLFGFFLRKGKALALLFALYPALLIVQFFPFPASLSFLPEHLRNVVLFFSALLVGMFLMRNLFIPDVPYGGVRRFLEIGLIALCTLALGLVALFKIALPGALNLALFFKTLFPLLSSPAGSFCVLLAPLVGTVIYARRIF